MPTHEQPAINDNPAQAGRDPEQLTAQGKPGSDAGIIDDLAQAQTDGSRNVRVTGGATEKHPLQGISEPIKTAYDTDNNAQASGITNQPLDKEKASQAEVGSEQKPR